MPVYHQSQCAARHVHEAAHLRTILGGVHATSCTMCAAVRSMQGLSEARQAHTLTANTKRNSKATKKACLLHNRALCGVKEDC
jgi:hypothetical protein